MEMKRKNSGDIIDTLFSIIEERKKTKKKRILYIFFV